MPAIFPVSSGVTSSMLISLAPLVVKFPTVLAPFYEPLAFVLGLGNMLAHAPAEHILSLDLPPAKPPLVNQSASTARLDIPRRDRLPLGEVSRCFLDCLTITLPAHWPLAPKASSIIAT